MNILIPMAGDGKRFQEAGYSVSKPAIPTYDVHSGEKLPMVVCAARCLPDREYGNFIFVDRDFHKADGTQARIQEYFPEARFITISELTQGQACTCLLAEKWIDGEEELLIAGCDNGMLIDREKWKALKTQANVIVFTFRNSGAVLRNPDAYGWMKVDQEDTIVDLSIKKAISDFPQNDHAVVSTFWFRHGWQFVAAAKKMIAENDRISNEFYVDQVIKYTLELGYRAKVFEIKRYIGWGTPQDYEQYQETFAYWRKFAEKENLV